MPSYHRLMMGAGPRRAVVYVIAGLLTIVVGLVAAAFARPGGLHVAVPWSGASHDAGIRSAGTVGLDSEHGRAIVDVEEHDGTVRRYYMEKTEDDRTRVWGGDLVETREKGE